MKRFVEDILWNIDDWLHEFLRVPMRKLELGFEWLGGFFPFKQIRERQDQKYLKHLVRNEDIRRTFVTQPEQAGKFFSHYNWETIPDEDFDHFIDGYFVNMVKISKMRDATRLLRDNSNEFLKRVESDYERRATHYNR
ncbi:MAG: hypothetical protein AAFV98_02850 [Chloroflexota bacterium]